MSKNQLPVCHQAGWKTQAPAVQEIVEKIQISGCELCNTNYFCSQPSLLAWQRISHFRKKDND